MLKLARICREVPERHCGGAISRKEPGRPMWFTGIQAGEVQNASSNPATASIAIHLTGFMAYVNHYKPVPTPTIPAHELYGPEPYDINFLYPLHEKALENVRTKLVPFIPSVHAESYWKQAGSNTENFRYYPFLSTTLPEFLAWLEGYVRRDPYNILFAVIDKTRPDPEHPEWGGSFAAVVGMYHTSPANLATEIGYVIVFPDFRGTHVAKDMVGLLLRYQLELPSGSPPGVGFRRVVWCAHPRNAPSIRLAEKMGFKSEGLLNWLWVLPEPLQAEGRPGRQGDTHSGKAGRDSIILSFCWDAWESGGKEHVEAILA
ncbi:acyl-CoA N-acyltransferase [Lenzites betulinus]|nr:acyl-CoA N-acyltransferase [Lenzites betulinus]